MKRIFFVEDDASLRSGLTFAMEKQGYAVTAACTRAEAESLWQADAFDLVVLDVSLPDGSGYDLCRAIRRTSQVPLIFLTAADEETEMIMGLDLGGDDYITKPFKLAVFFSRVNALLRRSAHFPQTARQLAAGGVTVDLLQQTVTQNGVPDGHRVQTALPVYGKPRPGAFRRPDSRPVVGLRGAVHRQQHPDGLHPAAADQNGGGPRPPEAHRDGAGDGL